MKAVVMAGGEGTRLRPLTSNQPKPMIPFLNKPVIEYIFELLKKHDFHDIIATLQFLPQLVKTYYGTGTDMGIRISYSIEEVPLGTAGSVKNASEYLTDTFLVISGDALTDFDLSKAIKFHRKKKSSLTIVLKSVENPLEYGVVITSPDGKIERFLEKPGWGEVFSDTVNTGIYIIEPEILELVPANTPFDFSKDLFPMLLERGVPIYGCTLDGYWSDIGNLEQYMASSWDVLKGRANIEPPGIKMGENIWVGQDVYIHPDAKIAGPAVIGPHARIEAEAEIGELAVIGSNVVVEGGAHIHRSIINENSYIGPRAKLHGSIVGRSCDIRKGATLEQGVAIGDECVIGEGSNIRHGVKIYPFKVVDAGATVNSSIIWESRGVRTLFGKSGVSGLINIDITAQLALKLGLSFGSCLHKDSFVVISRDSNRASRMVKRALIAGLTATGVHVRDLRIAPAPVNRFNVHTTRSMGGIHVRTLPFSPQSLEINFYDEHGVDISDDMQRKIERNFFREEFRRAFFNEMGEIIYSARTNEFYVEALLKAISRQVLDTCRLKIIIDYGRGSSSLVMPYLAGKLNCDIVSINAFTDEAKSTLSKEEFENSLKQLSSMVSVFNADFGLLIDSASEKVFLIDDRGRRIGHDDFLHLMIDLVCRTETLKGKIAVPLSVSRIAEEVALRYERQVIRTKMNPRSLTDVAIRKDIIFAGAQGGGFIFPHFMPAYDALLALCKLVEMRIKVNEPLSGLIDGLPKCHLAQRNIFCSWDQRGPVMRSLAEEAKGKDVDILDGIKIFAPDGWVLIVPDPEELVLKIYAESSSNKKAEQQINKIVDLINRYVLQ